MPLFECEKCGCIESTVCTMHYWGHPAKLCSECSTGLWHERFDKVTAKGMKVDNQGFIWTKEEVVKDMNSYDIVGEVD